LSKLIKKGNENISMKVNKMIPEQESVEMMEAASNITLSGYLPGFCKIWLTYS
jgi:hypothetical protein